MRASRLDQPALARPDGDLAVSALSRPGDGEVMVLFLDGTWRLCCVAAWQRDPSGPWRVLLR
jgi:hypothetical protein